MADPNVYSSLLPVLKRALKQRHVSYRELARKLGMSESGVKKLLSGGDISLNRLSEITGVLGMHISDLLKETEERDFTDVRFTAEQEAFFLDHRDYFHFYWKLVYERWSVAEIEEKLNLTAKQSFRYLKKLDELGFIVLGPQEKLKIPKVDRIRWASSGPLVQRIYQEWAIQMMKDLARPKLNDDESFIIRYFKFRKRTYEEFLDSLRAVEREFVKRTTREMLVYTEGLETVRWISAADRNSFVPTL